MVKESMVGGGGGGGGVVWGGGGGGGAGGGGNPPSEGLYRVSAVAKLSLAQLSSVTGWLLDPGWPGRRRVVHESVIRTLRESDHIGPAVSCRPAVSHRPLTKSV